MVCRYKSQLGKSHRVEGVEAWHRDLDISTEQVHQNLRAQVPQGRSCDPDQDADELCHKSR